MILVGVVDDIGADRGLIVAESGFQGGAVRVAHHSNITLTSMEDLRANTEVERAQSEVSRLVERIAALHADSRRFWNWAPPSTPDSAIQTERMVEFAAGVFELHSMVLPKIVSQSYPIVLTIGGNIVAHDAEQLRPALIQRIETVAMEADALRALARSMARHAVTLLTSFEVNLAELLAAGRAFEAEPAGSDADAGRFVTSMRAVGDNAEALKTIVPSEVRADLIALMRWLVDHTYVIESMSQKDWDAEETSLKGFLAILRADLSAVTEETLSEKKRLDRYLSAHAPSLCNRCVSLSS